ncbi:MAG: beta-galactosidase [Armatimonadota bacterium]
MMLRGFAMIILAAGGLRAFAVTARIEPTVPDEETDVRALCTLEEGQWATFRWTINGRTVVEGSFAPSALVGCDAADDLARAGVENAAALPLVDGRRTKGVRISAASPLVLPAARYFDQKEGAIEFWFKPEWDGDDGRRHTMFWAGAPGGLSFFIEKESAPYQGLVFYIVEPGGPSHGVWTTGTGLRAGRWYHLRCYWDLDVGDAGACRMGMYLDGTLVDRSPSVASAISPGPEPSRLVFGRRDGGGSADCVIDEIQFSRSTPLRPATRIATGPGPRIHEATLEAWRYSAGDTVGFTLTARGREVAQVSVKVREAKGMYDQYGGWKQIKGKRTGFFHCEKQDGKWWMITPEGHAFFALGTDHARYGGHWCQKLGYAPYGRFVQQKYGDENEWAEVTIGRLKDWNFNLLSAGHSESLRHRGLAHTEFLSMGSSFSPKDDIVPKTTWTGFPNVFSPEWQRHCERIAAARCAPNADDSWLLGYFIDNELEWYGKSHRESGLFEEAFKKPAEHTAKQALVRFLKQRHSTIVGFNETWGTRFADWEDLAASTEPPEANDPRTEADWRGFLRLVAELYFKVSHDAIRKYDPNHMIIGTRFAGRAPDIWDICGKYCDVVTLNYYGRVDMEREEAIGVEENFTQWFRAAKKPLMITEWSFPALDSGLPCTHGAGMRVDTQTQKAKCFRIYQTTFFRLPFMVGSDYFMYLDEPALGISDTFPEDSNYGLVNERDEPYPQLTAMAKRLQARVYEIHSGEAPELAAALRIRGRVAEVSVSNAGRTTANTEVEVRVDGSAERRRVRVAPGAEETVEFESAVLADGRSHYVVAIVDPDEETGDWDRRNNRAEEIVMGKRRRGARQALVVVANPMDRELVDVPVVVRVGDLVSVARLRRGLGQSVLAREGSGAPVLAQADRFGPSETLSAGDEVAMLLTLPANSCKEVLLEFSDRGAGSSTKRAFAFRGGEKTFTLNNGTLVLDATQGKGRLVDTIRLGEDVLGKLAPLVWQRVGQQNWWAAPDTTNEVRAHVGPVRAVIDVDASLTDVSAQREAPVTSAFRYRCVYRLTVYPGRPWFTSRFASIENTDERAWTMRAYFHFARSRLGGDRAGDAPGVKVPNYYLNIGVWGDEQAGLYYGCLAPEAPGSHVHFWTGAPGGPETQHADARRETNVALQAGDVYASEEPEFVLFGVRDDGTSAPWRGIVGELRALRNVEVRVRKAG